MPPPPTRARRVLVAVALVLLALPGLTTAIAGPEVLEDNVAPARFPVWPRSMRDAALFPMRFERAFDRSFRGRAALLAAWSQTMVLGLGAAALKPLGTVPERHVLVGRDGELFYGGDGSLESHRAADHARSDAQARAWCAHLARQRERATASGARYVVVIAPDKQSLYDDALPAWARRVGTPILDLLIPACAALHVDVVDVRPALARVRATERPYHRTDSHWNDVGACVAASVVTAHLGRAPTSPLSCVTEIARERERGGDLALLLGLRDVLSEEHPRAASAPRGVVDGAVVRGMGAGTAVLVGDSFSGALAPHVAVPFAELAIEKTLPSPLPTVDVVIEEVVERRLANGP